MKDQGRGPATYVVPWAPHLLNWALITAGQNNVRLDLYLDKETCDLTCVVVWTK